MPQSGGGSVRLVGRDRRFGSDHSAAAAISTPKASNLQNVTTVARAPTGRYADIESMIQGEAP